MPWATGAVRVAVCVVAVRVVALCVVALCVVAVCLVAACLAATYLLDFLHAAEPDPWAASRPGSKTAAARALRPPAAPRQRGDVCRSPTQPTEKSP